MAWTALASKQQTLGANRFAVSLLLGVFDRPSTTDECNCKNSAQNALKVAIFRLKIEKFSGSPEPVPHWGGGYLPTREETSRWYGIVAVFLSLGGDDGTSPRTALRCVMSAWQSSLLQIASHWLLSALLLLRPSILLSVRLTVCVSRCHSVPVCASVYNSTTTVVR